MARRYREHELRHVECLDGIWDFELLGEVEPTEIETSALRCADMMAVPGCFDALPRYALARGVAAYRRSLVLSVAGHYRLVFQGVQHVAHVFLAGQRIAQHEGGFTRFVVDLGALAAGRYELVVLVDNRLDWSRCPLHLDYFDWYHYGGISRSVELERLPTTWITAVAVDTLAVDPARLELRIDYESAAPGPTELRVAWDGQAVHSEPTTLEARGRITCVLELAGASLWSPTQPALHLLDVVLAEDDLRVRVGVRKIEVRGRELLLNGSPLELRGVNRHQAHPLFGHALPDSINLADIALIRELSGNFVRGAHYPQDPCFLDLCDEVGLCVWNEAIGWQHTAEHLQDPRFVAAQVAHIEEMVAMSRNHASVVLWGILNEGHSHQAESRPGYERLFATLRALDVTRPLTSASMFGYDDVCFDLADVVSVNTYPGWYYGELASIPETLAKLLAHLERTQPNKPVIVSEIGAAAIFGCHELGAGRWTEEYQADLLEAVLTQLFEGSRVAGVALWQFTDTRTSDRISVVLGKPRGYNNKGLLDEYRRPKLAYARVARLFRARAEREAPRG